MIKFLLAFLISTASFAATPGAVPSVTVSAPGANTGQVSIPPSDLSGTGVHKIFSLYTYASLTGTGYWATLYRDGVAYATGATTKAYCFDITASSSNGTGFFQFVSSQAAIAYNTNTALTNPAYQGGASGNTPMSVSPTTSVQAVVPGTYVFGDGVHVTYAAVQVSNVTPSYNIHMDCFEQ